VAELIVLVIISKINAVEEQFKKNLVQWFQGFRRIFPWQGYESFNSSEQGNLTTVHACIKW
jgi:hypothetical protein